MSRLRRCLVTLTLSMLAAACAERSAPDTGARDATPSIAEDAAPSPSLDARAAADAEPADAQVLAPDGGSGARDAEPLDATTRVDGGASGAPVPLADLIPTVSAAVCGALARCCDEASRAAYFAPVAQGPRWSSVAARVPPAATWDAAACPALLTDVVTIQPLGSWVAAATRGEVTYDGEAARACVDTLATAACGGDLRDALFDGTCFGLSAPGGGAEQRRMFRRTRGAGQTCAPILDGQGGVLFGTCDPSQAYCCFPSARDPSACAIRDTVPGVCRAASDVGEACTFLPNLQLCKTGLECGADERCAAPRTAPLPLGAPCWDDAAASLLGECTGGYCDIGATNRCAAPRADGEACTAPYECAGEACEGGVCTPSTLCTMAR